MLNEHTDKVVTMPILSIIIPVYNAEKTIGRTLDSLNSIPKKSREQIEVVLVDDGSTDSSLEIVTSKREVLSCFSVNIKSQENGGSAAARNTALKICAGEWVFFLDADDELVFDPIQYITQYSDCSALGFSVRFYKNLKPRGILTPILVSPDTHLDVCTASNPFQPSNFLIKRDRITSFFDKRFIFLEDWVFWFKNPYVFENMRIFKKTISANIYVHGENKSANYRKVGTYREKVADEILANFDEKLTQKQRNNLLIQEQIGLILQGKKVKLKNFLLFPCNIKLYGKLVIYAVLRSYFPKFDIYGS